MIGDIVKAPIKFLGNLIAGVKGGILKFKDNILDHLRKGLMSWLFGALAGFDAHGRIQPGRIEDVVLKSRKEVENGMQEAAEQILYELGLHGLNPEIVKVIQPETIFEKTGYSAPHTAHCGPDGIYLNALGSPSGS